MKWALLAGLLVCGNCWGDWWTESKLTNGLMISANVLMMADWAQTRYASDSGLHYEDGLAKHFIGSSPTTGDVNRYFVASIMLMNLTGYLLPPKYKDWLYVGVILVEADAVHDNHSFGVGFKF